MTCPKCNGPDACNTQPAKTITEYAGILPTVEKTGIAEKHFATLQAAFALRGHRLERAFHGENTEPTYYAERWGLVRWLPTLHDAAMFLAQVRGRL